MKRGIALNKICPAYHGIQMGTILGQIFCTFHKDGCIFGRNFLYISIKWVHFSGKNVCTLGRKFVPEPSITSKIHREPSPGGDRSIISVFLAAAQWRHNLNDLLADDTRFPNKEWTGTDAVKCYIVQVLFNAPSLSNYLCLAMSL